MGFLALEMAGQSQLVAAELFTAAHRKLHHALAYSPSLTFSGNHHVFHYREGLPRVRNAVNYDQRKGSHYYFAQLRDVDSIVGIFLISLKTNSRRLQREALHGFEFQ